MNIKLIISCFSLAGVLISQKISAALVIIDSFSPYDNTLDTIADSKQILNGSAYPLANGSLITENSTLRYTFSQDKLLNCQTHPTFSIVSNKSENMSVQYQLFDTSGINYQSRSFPIPNSDSRQPFDVNFFEATNLNNLNGFLPDQVNTMEVNFIPSNDNSVIELSTLEAVPEPCSLLMLVGGGAKYFNKLKIRKRKEELRI